MIQQATDAMGGIVCINDLKHSGHLQIVKEVRDNLKMSPIGTIRLSINSDALEQIRKNVNFASEGAVLILDEKNQIVQGQASELSKKADQLFQATEGEFEYQMQKKKYQVVYRVSDTTKWKVIGIIPLREISADLLPIQKQMIKTLMIGIFISSILSVFYYPMSSYVRFGQLYWRCTGFQKEILKYVSAKKEKMNLVR